MIDLEELEPVLGEAQETATQASRRAPAASKGPGGKRSARPGRRSSRSRTDRAALLPTMPGNLLPLYESLRKGKGGRAIAIVERGTCQGCRLSLTTPGNPAGARRPADRPVQLMRPHPLRSVRVPTVRAIGYFRLGAREGRTSESLGARFRGVLLPQPAPAHNRPGGRPPGRGRFPHPAPP